MDSRILNLLMLVYQTRFSSCIFPDRAIALRARYAIGKTILHIDLGNFPMVSAY